MNKILLTICTIIIVGCAEKEEFEKVVLEQMAKEKDIVDYKIDPEMMKDCVSATVKSKMPGVIGIDPERRKAYTNYTKMLRLNESADPKKTMEELRVEFGSAKGLADAHANYGESVVECMAGLVTGDEDGLQGK